MCIACLPSTSPWAATVTVRVVPSRRMARSPAPVTWLVGTGPSVPLSLSPGGSAAASWCPRSPRSGCCPCRRTSEQDRHHDQGAERDEGDHGDAAPAGRGPRGRRRGRGRRGGRRGRGRRRPERSVRGWRPAASNPRAAPRTEWRARWPPTTPVRTASAWASASASASASARAVSARAARCRRGSSAVRRRALSLLLQRDRLARCRGHLARRRVASVGFLGGGLGDHLVEGGQRDRGRAALGCGGGLLMCAQSLAMSPSFG